MSGPDLFGRLKNRVGRPDHVVTPAELRKVLALRALALSVPDIAARIGISGATIYVHFLRLDWHDRIPAVKARTRAIAEGRSPPRDLDVIAHGTQWPPLAEIFGDL